MTHQELFSHVADRIGLQGPIEAERVVRAVHERIGERLSHRDAEALAEEVPPGIARFLRGVTHGQDFELSELHARVARREGVGLGFAVEHTAVVCQALAEGLRPATLHLLHRALPEPIAALFQPGEPREPLEHVHLDPTRGTLAEGRPGGCHPIYAAGLDRAHTESVASSDNPHADTKLSSARGLTQEREGETLSAGRPGSSHPVSEGR